MFFSDEDDFLMLLPLLSEMNGELIPNLSIYRRIILVFRVLVFQKLFHLKKKMILSHLFGERGSRILRLHRRVLVISTHQYFFSSLLMRGIRELLDMICFQILFGERL